MSILAMKFMQHAVLAAVMASLACGVVGSLVVVNRMVFLAGGVAHTAYGGVGLAFYAGLPVMPCTIGFTLMASGGMAALTVRHKEKSDAIIGVLWAAGMALGILLMDLSPGYNVDLMSYLFGSILTVSSNELWFMLVLDLVLLGVILLFYKEFTALSFDQEFARSKGIPVNLLYFLLVGLIAVSVVIVIQVVGLILIIALLSIPPYLAQQKSSNLACMMFMAVGWSLAFCWAGLFFAYKFDLTSGACIIAVAVICFLLVQGLGRIKNIGRTAN
jgi:zinc transport system permease protein